MSKKQKTPVGLASHLAYGVTLVIPVRGREPLLEATVRNALRTAGMDIAVIIVYDGPVEAEIGIHADSAVLSIDLPEGITGTSAARHAGVVAASTRIVATCDAHMNFSQDWAVALINYFVRHETTVACATMHACDADYNPKPGATRPYYTGAGINALVRRGGEARAMVAEWDDNEPGACVRAVMGAFYAFSRDWYYTIGQPWAVGTGWGCDEELISLASWGVGGDCRLLPAHVRVYHVFDRVSRTQTVADVANVWRNRFRLLHLFPFQPHDRAELLEEMSNCRAFAPYRSEVLSSLPADLDRPECRRLIQVISKFSDPFREYVAKKIYIADMGTRTPPLELPLDSAGQDVRAALAAHTQPTEAQVIIVPATRCDRCGAVNSFAMRSSGRSIPATDHSPRRHFCRCRECNARAVRIFDGTILQGRSAVVSAINQ